jgi:hypothetical protein
MSLSDLAAIGSVISGLAVLGSLVYLAQQTRQAGQNQMSLMQQGRTSRWLDLVLKATEPSLRDAIALARQPNATLDAFQVQSLLYFGIALLWGVEDSFLQHRAGLLDNASWATELAVLRANVAVPDVRVTWKMNRHAATGDYRDFVDALMLEIKPIKPQDLLAAWNDLMAKELAEAV